MAIIANMAYQAQLELRAELRGLAFEPQLADLVADERGERGGEHPLAASSMG